MAYLERLIGPRILPPRRAVALALAVAAAIASPFVAEQRLGTIGGFDPVVGPALYVLGLALGSWTVLLLPFAITLPAILTEQAAEVGAFDVRKLIASCAVAALAVAIRKLVRARRAAKSEPQPDLPVGDPRDLREATRWFAGMASLLVALTWLTAGGRPNPDAWLVVAAIGLAAAISFPLPRSGRRNAALAVLLLISVPLVMIFLYVLLILVASLGCPPHAYECPV